MKNNDLKNKQTHKLESELKGNKIVASALSGILILLFIISIYGIIMREDKLIYISLLIVGISCSVILFSQFSSMKKIQEELKSRKLN